MPSRAERYLNHLDGLADDVEPDFYRLDSTKDGLADITAIVYHDLPEPGHLIGVTYGLSLSEHPDWRHGKPELSICVQSQDVAWALAIAHLAESLRGDCPFDYGATIDLGEPVSDESAMTGFVVFAPVVLDREDYEHIPVGNDPEDVVTIVGCYPVHDTERRFVQEHGLEAFWGLDWDPYDVTRPPAV
ncbi:suppressor of fused domain protein [Labedaea rhizosphaerae]|uniref:Suppressor of fused protein SUFU n=1 Tax=Labedaea rhizosphaerae TaxID=598644 RepID=A0A4R6S8B1_LABRH|nr:suppressor of fused domain protein [Labedaea rhizosphaerae]TDP96112.1 suppressor of fused protein SUFU [Labedaea rhizosphaerae]